MNLTLNINRLLIHLPSRSLTVNLQASLTAGITGYGSGIGELVTSIIGDLFEVIQLEQDDIISRIDMEQESISSIDGLRILILLY